MKSTKTYVLNEWIKISTMVLSPSIALIFYYVCYYHFLKKIKVLQMKLNFLLITTLGCKFTSVYSCMQSCEFGVFSSGHHYSLAGRYI